MPGGTWNHQNKIRPGAYINFKSVPKPASSVGERGIMTMAAPLPWGPANTVIPLYSTDLLDGSSQVKIGLSAFDAGSLTVREALSYAYLCLLYRLDTGGVKAAATLGILDVTAKYAGSLGNQLSVAIAKNTRDNALFDVITYLSGSEKDRQTVGALEALVGNGWVEFSGAGEPEESPGAALTGGKDGTVAETTYTDYFAAIGQSNWNTMALLSTQSATQALAAKYIQELRDNQGKKRQIVYCADSAADSEGVIVTKQGYVNKAGETIAPELFPATVASMTAAAKVNQSNTYLALTGATEIIGPMTDSQIKDALTGGLFVLSTRQDGVIVVEQDINSFVTFTPHKSRDFRKNRVIRCLDDINNAIVLKFERGYIGKVDNNAAGRSIFKADVISYLTELQNMGAIQNFDPASDIVITQGQEIEAVGAQLWIQPVDAMEKLYMDVYLR